MDSKVSSWICHHNNASSIGFVLVWEKIKILKNNLALVNSLFSTGAMHQRKVITEAKLFLLFELSPNHQN